MKTNDILNLDYRKEESRETIQKVLRKIKPLSKFSEENDIPLEAIEKAIRIMVKKYEISPQWLTMSYFENSFGIYSVSLKSADKSHRWLGNVYGMCLYEVFAKLAIKIYSEIKSGNIQERTISKEEKQREQIAKKIEKEGLDS